ncbi:sodium:solute symporter [Nanchangia anserum]|uniref:Sodium:solute symporter n=1 Tax=Nanchangia anserum TaxID=2692125 RepID=A0A8I0KUS2_9ACTO|nr:sodium:solute symporter [Nanchangia anserum]MBD3690008.1 sodium:solute symporter [Nanchangia anserum]QOX82191.1 sodium:solute symporter [Nanchangia anserum]
MDLHLSAIDFAVIAAYFIVLVIIGVASLHFAKTRDDYLVAGRRLGFPMFFSCMAALAVGGAVTVGGAQRGYEVGVSGVWVGGSLGMGLIVLGMLVSSKLSRLRALSMAEVIERNYGQSARILSAVLTIIYTVSLTVVQIVSIGAILQGIVGWSTTVCMLVGGGVVVFYTFIGGMWSVTMTDLLQFIVKTAGIIILVPIFVFAHPSIGGVSGFFAKVPESHADIGALGFQGTLYWILLYVPGLVIGQDIWQRVFTARTDTIARAGTLSAGVYAIIYALGGVLLGMATAIVVPNLADPSEAFSAGVATFLPVGVAGVLLAAAIAAAMSVASGTILACSTVVYNDIYLRLVRGVVTDMEDEAGNARETTKRDVWINRMIAFVLGIVMMGLAVAISDLFKALDLAYGFLSGCVFVPVIAGFVLKKVSPRAGLVSLAVSFLGVAGTMAYGEATGQPDFAIGGNWPIMVGMALSIVSYALVTVIDRRRITPNLSPAERAAETSRA